MKQRLCALFLLCALLLSACSQGRQASFCFYFRSADSAESVCARRAPISDASQLSLRELMELYLSFDPSGDAVSPFPEGCTLDEAYTQDGTAVITLTLSGIIPAPHRSAQCYACIARTLLQLDSVLRVRIVCGEDDITLTERDLLLSDTGMLPQQDEITLYYPDRAQRYLTSIRQTVAAMSDDELPEYVLEQLLSDTSRGKTSCIPDGTFLLGVQVSEDGLCTVNLSAAFRADGAYSCFNDARLAVYSIVNSLTELPGINAVSLQVSGTGLSALHTMLLGERLTHDRSLLAPSLDETLLDTDLYFPCTRANGLLVSLPYTVSVDKLSAVEAVVSALLSANTQHGLLSPVPEGTRILSVKLSEEICVVDLTAEAVAQDSPAAQKQLLMCIVASLCALEGVRSVQVLVEGLPPNYLDPDYADITAPDAAWFAE